MRAPLLSRSHRRRRRIQFPIEVFFDGDGDQFFIGGWSESGGNVLNDQIAVGASLWDAPAAIFTSGTYAWVALGTNTIANVANTLQITYVDTDDGAKVFFRDTDDLSSNLTIGQWYQFSVDTKANLGDYRVLSSDGVRQIVSALLVDTNFETIIITFNARNVSNAHARQEGMEAGQIVSHDNLSLKPMTLTSLFNTLKSQYGLADGFFIDVYINAVTIGTQIGILWNYDSDNNFGMAYMDGINLLIEKNVAGTHTELARVAQAVTQDQILRIENPAGSNVLDILYNGVSKATPTIADASVIGNPGIALFSTEANNAISKVVIGKL